MLKKKDYIKSPKDSGYRSIHLILEAPMHFGNEDQSVKIEVQLRTTAMDYWANLDYQLQYKKENKDVELIRKELKEYAAAIEEIDKKVIKLRKRIEQI